MGGKKKNLANRLAKMSDDERARYLQHKADQDEEARRRKEQLISTFLKIKIKKEEQFSRLNLAKINQNWHQILRRQKINDMKDDVEHMKKAIDRILEYKNRTIMKLLEELDQAEIQYSYNFASHSSHIDQTLKSNEEYLAKLRMQYSDDSDETFDIYTDESSFFLQQSLKNIEHLKTVTFGRQLKSRIDLKDDYEKLYLKKRNEDNATYTLNYEGLISKLDKRTEAIWREIAGVVCGYVRRNDTKRLHLAELKRLDAESADEIDKNQERIRMQEEEIANLEGHLKTLTEKREDRIANLQKSIRNESTKLESSRKSLKQILESDDRKLRIMTEECNQALDLLTSLVSKGKQIVTMSQTCKKFETPEEKLTKWLPNQQPESPETEEIEPSGGGVVDTVIFHDKSSSVCPPRRSSTIIDKYQRALVDLDGFWISYNHVRVHLNDLKLEKKSICEENKQFRGVVRAVLEAEALNQKSPQVSRISTTRPSRSAPMMKTRK